MRLCVGLLEGPGSLGEELCYFRRISPFGQLSVALFCAVRRYSVVGFLRGGTSGFAQEVKYGRRSFTVPRSTGMRLVGGIFSVSRREGSLYDISCSRSILGRLVGFFALGL